METLVAFIVLAALFSAFFRKVKFAIILFSLGLAGVIVVFYYHASDVLNLLF
ncbi:MAG: hypothetical protein ABI443_05315 [Chthoniobacterales bacterium]